MRHLEANPLGSHSVVSRCRYTESCLIRLIFDICICLGTFNLSLEHYRMQPRAPLPSSPYPPSAMSPLDLVPTLLSAS
jgi:hypothetical protein